MQGTRIKIPISDGEDGLTGDNFTTLRPIFPLTSWLGKEQGESSIVCWMKKFIRHLYNATYDKKIATYGLMPIDTVQQAMTVLEVYSGLS